MKILSITSAGIDKIEIGLHCPMTVWLEHLSILIIFEFFHYCAKMDVRSRIFDSYYEFLLMLLKELFVFYPFVLLQNYRLFLFFFLFSVFYCDYRLKIKPCRFGMVLNFLKHHGTNHNNHNSNVSLHPVS